MAFLEINHQVMSWKLYFEGLGQKYFGAERCNEVKKFANKHPFFVATVFLTLLFSALPIIIFICFAAISTAITVICFICVEGFLLLIGGLILVGIISAIGILTSGVTLFLSIAYWFAHKFHVVFCSNIHSQLPVPPRGEQQEVDSTNT